VPHSALSLHPHIIPAHDRRLRQESRPITSDEVWFAQQVWHSLRHIMHLVHDHRPFRHAMGLAAIQIGMPLQLCVIWTPQLDYVAMANPEIISCSIDSGVAFESGFSSPEWHGNIRRAKAITVRYWNEYLQPVEQEFHGWAARIIQQKVDHMHGILFTDRMSQGEHLLSDEDYMILKAAC